MGTKVGVWLDSEKAYIISLFEDRHVMETIESEVESRVRYEGETKSFSGKGGSLVNPSKKKTKRRKHQMDSYILSVLEKLRSAEGIYIFGPAECKRELEKGLIKRKDKPSIHIESADKMTERQMIARVKGHFSQ